MHPINDGIATPRSSSVNCRWNRLFCISASVRQFFFKQLVYAIVGTAGVLKGKNCNSLKKTSSSSLISVLSKSASSATPLRLCTHVSMSSRRPSSKPFRQMCIRLSLRYRPLSPCGIHISCYRCCWFLFFAPRPSPRPEQCPLFWCHQHWLPTPLFTIQYTLMIVAGQIKTPLQNEHKQTDYRSAREDRQKP